MAKMTVDFNPAVTEMLEKVAEGEGRTKVEVLRRAIGLYKYLGDEIKAGAGEERYLAILTKDGRPVKEVAWV